MFGQFKGFLTKTNALALAVGVIIGAAVGNVVSSLAADILMPIVGLALPGGDWRSARIVLTRTVDSAGKTVESAILYGHFIGALIDFAIIAFVLFLIVRALVRPVATADPEPMRTCNECLEMIPRRARRCRACTALVSEPEPSLPA
jgi:large conductance mechanosensitive channel